MNYYNIKYKFTVLTSILLLLVTLSFAAGVDQEPELRKTFMSPDITQDSENFNISASVWAKIPGNRKKDYLEGINLSVSLLGDTITQLLSVIKTDKNGKAFISIPKNTITQADPDGFYNFEILFEGNDSLKQQSKDLSVKKASLTMNFTLVDSVKMIEFTANETNAEGEVVSLSEFDINIYVKSLFSPLKVGSVWMEDGEASFEFPTDLPGDTLGYLYFISKIEDSDDHGIIEVAGTKDWAIKKEIATEIDRGLGDTDAPLWMVYTLIILLSVVWFHYIYIIYTYFVIKREGEKADS